MYVCLLARSAFVNRNWNKGRKNHKNVADKKHLVMPKVHVQ